MKHRLLTSTAMGALLATSGYVYAEGLGLRFFGGLNLLDKQSEVGKIVTRTSTLCTTCPTVLKHGVSGTAEFDADTGYVIGGAVNYQWDNGLILELEAAYRRNDLDLDASGVHHRSTLWTTGYTLTPTSTTTFGTGGIDGDGHVSAVSLMANAWYEFNIGNSEWKPYVGGGVGIAWVDMEGIATATSRATPTTTFGSTVLGFHEEESGFAWQLGAGIGYEFAPGKQVTLDYRYFNGPTIDEFTLSGNENEIDYDYQAHNIMVGIKLGI